jgi:hypothetical protein
MFSDQANMLEGRQHAHLSLAMDAFSRAGLVWLPALFARDADHCFVHSIVKLFFGLGDQEEEAPRVFTLPAHLFL